MYKIKIEAVPCECKVKVYVENVVIVFEADSQEESHREANRFVLELLKDTGRLGY